MREGGGVGVAVQLDVTRLAFILLLSQKLSREGREKEKKKKTAYVNVHTEPNHQIWKKAARSIGVSFEFERPGFEVQASPKPSGVYCAERRWQEHGERHGILRFGGELSRKAETMIHPTLLLSRAPLSDLFSLPLILVSPPALLKRTYTRSFHRGESMVSEK